MLPSELQPADRPTFYFVGVTTARSSIMQVFPRWAEYLHLGDCRIQGIDCRMHDEAAVYRHVVSFIRNDPLSLGALVTTHKMDLFAACRDLFDELDPAADLLGEISCISKLKGRLRGSAKDPQTSGLSLEAFLPADQWSASKGEVCILGAGGASLALTTYFVQIAAGLRRPRRIHVTDQNASRLNHMRRVHARIDRGVNVVYHACPMPLENDAVVNRLPPGSLVVNATGLGKDAPGSPLTDGATFPNDGWAWDFNYRGDLVFLKQARAQQERQRLKIEDGWVYFLHGWTRVIAEVFHTEIPTHGPVFEQLSRLAASARQG